MKYAAYGSNLHPRRLQLRTGEARLLGSTRVDGLALRFHKRGNLDGSGKCNIISNGDSCVYLAVFEIPEQGIARLDIAEGVGAGYERSSIRLARFGDCLTYRAQATHIDDQLRPFSWYKDLVLAGCRAHDFPGDYVRAIEEEKAVIDPDPQRHAVHRRLLEGLGKVF